MGQGSEPAKPTQQCAEVWRKGELAGPMRTRKIPGNRGTAPESEFLGVLLSPHINRGSVQTSGRPGYPLRKCGMRPEPKLGTVR